MSRDRKDIHPDGHHSVPAAESARERAARKAHESHALDEALKETFPTSDPVSPFIPAIPTENEPAAAESDSCAHPGCTCPVRAPEIWCSEVCRDQQQGYVNANATCMCEHDTCCHRDRASIP
ncbi:hypothetical protein [Dokdonella ginsengisoli]|uniref:Uncharacterized protein n=1 Tax=Dokdonella ginsengisoli TaxID=363846 RepID=A0ABV9QYR9_9GAMM